VYLAELRTGGQWWTHIVVCWLPESQGEQLHDSTG
jgi:hypothetical protein